MKKFLVGLVAGLVMGLTLFNGNPLEGSAPTIRLIVNGHIVNSDVPPLMINNRVMVPARFVAEPLGATVTWNESMQAVIINTRPATNKNQIPDLKTNTTTSKPAPTTTTTTTTKSVGSGVKTPVAPTSPATTLTDETGKTKSGLQELTPDWD